MLTTIAIQLAETGSTINVLIPIIGGLLLVGGIAAIVVSQLRRRKLSAPLASAAPEAPADPAPTAEPDTQ